METRSLQKIINAEIVDLLKNKDLANSAHLLGSPLLMNTSYLVYVVLTPQSGFFENCKIPFRLQIPPEYPNLPIRAYSVKRIYHPNVCNASGRVCLNILATEEHFSELKIRHYVGALLWLLDNPNFESRLNPIQNTEFHQKHLFFFQGKHSDYDQILDTQIPLTDKIVDFFNTDQSEQFWKNLATHLDNKDVIVIRSLCRTTHKCIPIAPRLEINNQTQFDHWMTCLPHDNVIKIINKISGNSQETERDLESIEIFYQQLHHLLTLKIPGFYHFSNDVDCRVLSPNAWILIEKTKCLPFFILAHIFQQTDMHIEFVSLFNSSNKNVRGMVMSWDYCKPTVPLIVVPTKNTNSHNYNLEQPVVQSIKENHYRFFRKDGTLGNHLDTNPENYRLPTISEIGAIKHIRQKLMDKQS